VNLAATESKVISDSFISASFSTHARHKKSQLVSGFVEFIDFTCKPLEEVIIADIRVPEMNRALTDFGVFCLDEPYTKTRFGCETREQPCCG